MEGSVTLRCFAKTLCFEEVKKAAGIVQAGYRRTTKGSPGGSRPLPFSANEQSALLVAPFLYQNGRIPKMEKA